MGTKWVPRFVRISPSIPQTATGKITKVGLREEAWICSDEVWWWALGSAETNYRLLTKDDRTALAEGLAVHGRPPIGPLTEG
jgi:fatty-acyl-CoA synthase